MKNVTKEIKNEYDFILGDFKLKLEEFSFRNYYSNPQTYYALGKMVLGGILLDNDTNTISLLDCLGLYFVASSVIEVLLSGVKACRCNREFNESIGNLPIEYSIPRLFLRSQSQRE